MPCIKFFKRLLLFFLIFCMINLHAKSYLFSPLPPANQQIVTTEPCSLECLKDLMLQNQIFSFVSQYDNNNQDESLKTYYKDILNKLNPIFIASQTPAQESYEPKIELAVLLPKKVVGRYAISVMNTLLAYLNTRNNDFNIQVFDSDEESPEKLEQTYKEIEKEKFPFVIALLTKEGVENLLQNTTINTPTYVPTVNRVQLENNIKLPLNERLYFGGIDYKEQLSMLTAFINPNSPVIEYDDDGLMGERLRQITESLNIAVKHQENISYRQATSFSKNFKKDDTFFKDSTLILNTPTTKSGLILSQIGLLEERPVKILSAQINFNPSLLLLTQPKDRKNLFIVNALQNSDEVLIEYASLLESDLKHDWVNYSSAIGLEMFLSVLDPHFKKSFQESLEDNQVRYHNQIYQALGYSFELMQTQKE
ncbi:IS701 family transposase [Helicobacter pylori]|nr:IS701 family transposase [Helicobacter pylori]